MGRAAGSTWRSSPSSASPPAWAGPPCAAPPFSFPRLTRVAIRDAIRVYYPSRLSECPIRVAYPTLLSACHPCVAAPPTRTEPPFGGPLQPPLSLSHPRLLPESPICRPRASPPRPPPNAVPGPPSVDPARRPCAAARFPLPPPGGPRPPSPLSESPIRVCYPSLFSESPIRVCFPSRLSARAGDPGDWGRREHPAGGGALREQAGSGWAPLSYAYAIRIGIYIPSVVSRWSISTSIYFLFVTRRGVFIALFVTGAVSLLLY